MTSPAPSQSISVAALPERVGELVAAAARAIELAGVSGSPLNEARFLLANVVDWPVASLFAFPERRVPRPARVAYAELLARRVAGEPVGYIVGMEGFFSLMLLVGPEVLVPRPETELLVESVLARCALMSSPAILDVGTGSGAIAIAVKHERRDVRMTALDASAEALKTASANAHFLLGLSDSSRWLTSVWFEAVGSETFDLIVSNPPYVRTADVVGTLKFEPRLALDGGADGLAAYRVLFAEAANHLNAGGALLVEHGADQRPELVALAHAHGWRVAAARDDLAGRPRVLELERGAVP